MRKRALLSFMFLSADSSNVVVKKNAEYVKSSSNAGEFYDKYYGDIVREFRIVLDDQYKPYYLNPDKNIVVHPDQTANAGNVFTNVRSYGLTVTVKPDWLKEQFTHAPIPNMIVYLLRKQRPLLVPPDEGKRRPPQPMTIKGMEVIGIDTSDVNGRVTFSRLVKSPEYDDHYYLWAESDPVNGKENYKVGVPDLFRFDYKDQAFYSSEYKYSIC